MILTLIIRVPKVPFCVFDKLKTEIQNSFYLNMKDEIKLIDHYFHVLQNFTLNFLMLSFLKIRK